MRKEGQDLVTGCRNLEVGTLRVRRQVADAPLNHQLTFSNKLELCIFEKDRDRPIRQAKQDDDNENQPVSGAGPGRTARGT
jgi:hypothetical protein